MSEISRQQQGIQDAIDRLEVALMNNNTILHSVPEKYPKGHEEELDHSVAELGRAARWALASLREAQGKPPLCCKCHKPYSIHPTYSVQASAIDGPDTYYLVDRYCGKSPIENLLA